MTQQVLFNTQAGITNPELSAISPARPLARATDPVTSHLAAERARPRLTITRKRILRVLSDVGPMCDEDIGRALQARGWYTSPSGVRGRRRELVQAGLVIDSGLRATTQSGNSTIVWRINIGAMYDEG